MLVSDAAINFVLLRKAGYTNRTIIPEISVQVSQSFTNIFSSWQIFFRFYMNPLLIQQNAPCFF
jgi:hypothetical protein